MDQDPRSKLVSMKGVESVHDKSRKNLMALPKLPLPVLIGLLTTVYTLLAKFSLTFAIPPGNASALWPAAGLAVASCLAYGYRVWPAILIGATIVNATTVISPGFAFFMGIGNTLETLAIVWLIHRYTKITDKFYSSVDVFRFVVFVAIGALISSSIGVTTLFAGGYISGGDFQTNWITWWLGDVTGIAITAPALITWRSNAGAPWDQRKLAEILLFSALFSACGFFIFTVNKSPFLYLFLPFIVWLAFRFSQSEVTKAVFVLASIAAWGTVNDGGPFADFPINSALMLLQLFVSIVGITGLALTVTIDERYRSANYLRRMQDELEALVVQRTAQLKTSVETLQLDITVRENIQQELQTKEKQLEEAQKLAHLGSWNWDVREDRLTMSAEMARIYGAPQDGSSLTYNEYLEYIPVEDRPLVDTLVRKALDGMQPFHYEHGVVRPDGTLRTLRCAGAIETDAAGTPVRLYGTAHDLTEEKVLEKKLLEAEELYRKLVELSPDAIYLLDDERCVFSNSAGFRLLGAERSEQLIGRDFLDFISPGFRKFAANTLQRLPRSEKNIAVEGQVIQLDGTIIDIELAATAFNLKNRRSTLLVARDISERKKIEQEIQRLAHYDVLTGLANRLLFKERLEHAISQSNRTGNPLIVLFIDLDRFKAVNDTSGHGAGDEVLRECAQRLQACVRDSDTIARSGGDEFLILLESYFDPHHVSALTQKILSVIRQPFYAAGKEFEIDASIGISTCPTDGAEVETLIKHADIAMYRAKLEGKSHFCFYSPSMTLQGLERYAMELSLRHALERGEMELYYQPKINLHTGRMSGAEALIRWNHPEFGQLLPCRFISVAEEIGVISDMGLWALGEVCARCKDWQEQGLPATRIAVNLTYAQFSDENLFDKIKQLLDNAGLAPSILELEITETMVMENAERLMHFLHQFKELGVHLSVDDFGTGYSSLAYLKRLPVDSVKVDRSFIKDLPADSEDSAITRAILALVHSLKRVVVAEGVETREQLDFLIDHGCDEVQGFYFSPALPSDQFREFLADQKQFLM